jgi:hypothetical protein
MTLGTAAIAAQIASAVRKISIARAFSILEQGFSGRGGSSKVLRLYD